MKLLAHIFVVFFSATAFAQSLYEKIDSCGNSARCVGYVLADHIGGGDNDPVLRTLYFYSSNDASEGCKTPKAVVYLTSDYNRNLQKCESLTHEIQTLYRWYKVGINGSCTDFVSYSDSFRSVCKKLL